MTKRVFNFYAGPATLPLTVLEKAKEEFLDFANMGMSVLEISHRSKPWDKVMADADSLVREIMGVPSDYKIIWLGGGASTQFLMVPVNLQVAGKPMEYVSTGGWAEKAIKEAGLYGDVKIIASSKDENHSYIPKDVSFSDNAAYGHITSNNTLYGTEWHYWPAIPSDVSLVCDMSSDLMARKINVKDFGVIYAGAQKNLGPAGVTLAIVREDLLSRVPEKTPTMLKWSTHAEDSMYNTPPVFPIYISKLSLEYLKEIGGVKEIERRNREKARILYDVIDTSDGFYKGHAKKDSRSLMNITFTMATPELEDKCVQGATSLDLIGLKGHRSVGGMRASIYNAMPIEGVQKLAKYLTEFKEKNQ
ncbi:MAG: 3-phosphoserine/phosphohydroxythreonine transaminase [Candidatus Thorarchaeota archaeon]|nr:MAG: 3-phosphoserine/phosphohydroxythreonine transaminase [Candidatus Thorarchaeota archaeon]